MENNTENFRQPLFNHLSKEHDLTLLDSELDEIITIASKIADEKRNESVKEKYGIELILKEMWVWERISKSDISHNFVICKDKSIEFCYLTVDINGNRLWTTNASETDPRTKQEPKVGDVGYFWDDESGEYYHGKLTDLPNVTDFRYSTFMTDFINFSTEKQPWMK